jgi:hypothetical protein
MKSTGSLTAKLAGATSLALLLTTSAFADSRPQDQTYRRDSNRGRSEASRDVNRDSNRSDSYRENDRVTLQGKITSFNRENNGYRVHLDRGPAFWVPETYYRTRRNDFRVGVSISLGGVYRGGSVYVDDYGYNNSYNNGYNNGYANGSVRGVVDRVDFRRGTVWLRDERSGRLIEADMRADRYGRLNIDDLRRGDFVELSGSWIRGGVFAANRIDTVRSGRRY